jgi:hypothetical protein
MAAAIDILVRQRLTKSPEASKLTEGEQAFYQKSDFVALHKIVTRFYRRMA